VLGRALGESEMLDLFHTARSFAETRCPWLLSPPNKAMAMVPARRDSLLGMVGRFPEAPISFSTRKTGLSDG
jgi:hypothetical protein